MLTATDSRGVVDTDTVTVFPQTVAFTLTTSPTGLDVVYDGASGTAPLTRTTIVGSTHTVYAPSPQGSATFSSWSDGGPQQHAVTVGSADVTYTAAFATPGAPPGGAPPPGAGDRPKAPRAPERRTLTGTSARDVLLGTAADELLRALRGSDSVFARGGDDVVYGGQGNDAAYGDQGNDLLYGDRGRDRLYGGVGDDRLFGGIARDLLVGGGGADVIFARHGGADLVRCGAGSDVVRADRSKSRPQRHGRARLRDGAAPLARRLTTISG